MALTTADSWFGAPTVPMPAVSAERVAEAIVADLEGIPMGGFPVTVAPIVAPRAAYQELLDVTGRLLDLQRRAVLKLAADHNGRMIALGLDPANFVRGIKDQQFEIRHCAEVARADVVIGVNGPQFIEFNVGAGIGGMVQFETMRRAWGRIRAEAGLSPLLGVDPFEQLALLIKQTCRELGVAPTALLIGSLSDPSVSARYAQAQLDFLGEHGVTARYVNLDRAADLLREPLDTVLGIVQVCENEAQIMDWDLSPIVAAMRAGMRAIPTETTRMVDSKKVLAMLSEGLPWMSVEERQLVRRFVPWTRTMGDRRVVWHDGEHNLPRLLIDRQELFVLKGASGYSSQDVFFGARTDSRRWRELVESAVESEYYVAQEMVTPVRHPIPVMLNESGKTEPVSGNSVISPFFVGGVATGCLVRFDSASEPDAVTVRSGARLACLLGDPR